MSKKIEETQAKKLQQLFAEVTNEVQENKPKTEEPIEFVEVDVLNLPPRSEVHLSPRQKITLNFKKPYIRLIIVFIILIVLISFAYFGLGDQIRIFISR